MLYNFVAYVKLVQKKYVCKSHMSTEEIPSKVWLFITKNWRPILLITFLVIVTFLILATGLLDGDDEDSTTTKSSTTVSSTTVSSTTVSSTTIANGNTTLNTTVFNTTTDGFVTPYRLLSSTDPDINPSLSMFCNNEIETEEQLLESEDN
jgi:hypothetical protein